MPDFTRLVYVSGPPGEQGPEGPQGPQGAAGVGSEIGSANITLIADGTVSDADIPNGALITIASSGAPHTIRGIEAIPTVGNMFPTKEFVNIGTYNIIWTNQDSGAAASDRIIVPEGGTYTQEPNTSVFLNYDFTINRWRKTAEADAVVDGLVISDLSTRNIVRSGEAVTLAGRISRNDGSGFLVTGEVGASDTVDNVNIFSAPNGRYKRTHGWGRNLKPGREVNLFEDFGVVADGTDQKARLQEAFDWYNAQADAWLAVPGHELGNYVMPFYWPGSDRAVRIDSSVVLHGGNHKKIIIRGDGHLCPYLNPYGDVTWNDPYVCAGSVLQAGGSSAGNFELFTFPDVYSYIDIRRMAFGNRGSGSCLRAVSTTPAANTVIRLDDVFCFGGKVGYFAESTVTCLSNYDVHVRGCETGIQLGNRALTDYNREAWDVKFFGTRVEGCVNAIALHGCASVYFVTGLIQSNTVGIVGHSDYTIASCGFQNLHFEGNTGGDFDIPQFTTNPGGVANVVIEDCRIAGSSILDVPFGWRVKDMRCDSFSWPEAYGPNRATLEARNISIEDRACVLDFTSGVKRVVGSSPTRFTNTKRRYRVTIGGNANGTYQILVNAVSRATYIASGATTQQIRDDLLADAVSRATYIASGATTQQIRDDLLADLISWGGCSAAAVSTNAIDIDSPLYDGSAFVVTQSSSGSVITVGTVSHFIALDALATGDFVEIDNITQPLTLFAPTHAPQGWHMWIRLRMDTTGGHAITLSGFSYGTQRYTNDGNLANTETWIHAAFDDLNQWGILEHTGWIGASFDPSVLSGKKLTLTTTNPANNLSLATAVTVCENPAVSGQSINVWSFAGDVKSGVRASFGGHLATYCGVGTYHQFYGSIDETVPICNMSAIGLNVGGTAGETAVSQLTVKCQSASRIVAKFKAIASQTADVLQVESSSGTGDLLAIDAAGIPHFSTEAGITASTTQTQGQRPLTKHTNQIATVANANDVVTLPPARAGAQCIIISYGSNTLQVFPASGDQINALGLNISTTIAANSQAMFVAFDNTNWRRM